MDGRRFARGGSLKRVAVFCASSHGARPEYTAAARGLGELLVREGVGLVYGGGSVGLMGELADAMLARGGDVIGVIPRMLWEREIGHREVDLRVVETMHERKAMMADLAEGFIALPGGLGTLEEILEVWTWAQLGMHQKPCAFLDVAGYYAPLAAFLDRAVEEQFVREQHRAIAIIEDDAGRLLARMRTYEPPRVVKWIDRSET